MGAPGPPRRQHHSENLQRPEVRHRPELRRGAALSLLEALYSLGAPEVNALGDYFITKLGARNTALGGETPAPRDFCAEWFRASRSQWS